MCRHQAKNRHPCFRNEGTEVWRVVSKSSPSGSTAPVSRERAHGSAEGADGSFARGRGQWDWRPRSSLVTRTCAASPACSSSWPYRKSQFVPVIRKPQKLVVFSILANKLFHLLLCTSQQCMRNVTVDLSCPSILCKFLISVVECIYSITQEPLNNMS